MRNKYFVSFTLAALLIVAATGIHSLAQSDNPASNAQPTNAMSRYVKAVRSALISGTEATNLTDVEVSRLMNDSIKTNLAAQLWFRSWLSGGLSAQGAKMSGELRVLESLRAGRTNDAIRELEDSLDSDIISLATHLTVADMSKFKWTPRALTALQWAKDYRLKFPYKTGDPATDERVKDGLSYLERK